MLVQISKHFQIARENSIYVQLSPELNYVLSTWLSQPISLQVTSILIFRMTFSNGNL